MKTIIASILTCVTLFAATVANAETAIKKETIAQIAIPMPVEANTSLQPGTTHFVIKLQNGGRLVVEKWLYSWSRVGAPEFKGRQTLVLKDSVARMIRDNVIALSNAEIKTTYSDVVCMMMPLAGPSPALFIKAGYDYNTEGFSGDLRVVESNTGCWAHEHINLANDYDVRTAASLTAYMQVLVMQLAK